ncbi:MAG TPA: hypothetical protein VF638_13880 [Sphingomonas sp.]|jgi:hypothetical protein
MIAQLDNAGTETSRDTIVRYGAPGGEKNTIAPGEGAGSLYGRATGNVAQIWGTARRKAAANPFAAVAGATAVGVGLGWLLPSSDREKKIMGQVATKVSDAAHDAANAAVEAGRQQAEDLTQNALASVGGAVVGAVLTGAHKPE